METRSARQTIRVIAQANRCKQRINYYYLYSKLLNQDVGKVLFLLSNGNLTRMGPFHGPCGGTDCPRCEISSNPACARCAATSRTRGMSARHPVGDSARATSDGHALESGPRW
jgi:hypothetical protein